MKRTILALIALGCVSPAMAAQDPVNEGHYGNAYDDMIENGTILPVQRNTDSRLLEEVARGNSPWDSGPAYVDSGDYYIGASRPN